MLASNLSACQWRACQDLLELPARNFNWGPQTASGTSVVAIADEYVTMDVQGLPVLTDGHYGVWLQSRVDRKFYAVGTFNVDSSGSAHFEVHDDGIPYQDYRMLLITDEPATGGGPGPSDLYSLAGILPNHTATATPAPDNSGLAASGAGTAVPRSGVTTSGPKPTYLPTTGGQPAKLRPVEYAVGFLLVAVVLYAVLRRRGRDKAARHDPGHL